MKSLIDAKAHFSALREIFGLLTKHRQLTWEMAKREITERYSGQVFGVFWAVGHPLFLMGVYVFIFAFVFRIKIGGTFEMPLDYTTYIVAGLIPWMSFNEAMNKSCASITGNANLVKQVIFPIEVLPAKAVLASLFNQVISTIILVLYVLCSYGSLPWTYLLLPVLLILQTLAMIGVSYLIASVSVFLRDTKDFVQLFGLAGMYLMPIVYLPAWVPQIFKPFLYANPFSYLIWCYQDTLYFGRFEHPEAWIVFVVESIGIFVIGYRVFRKLKPAFGNVL